MHFARCAFLLIGRAALSQRRAAADHPVPERAQVDVRVCRRAYAPPCVRACAGASARVRSLYGAGRRGSRSTPITAACRARYALGYYWGDESKRVFFEHQQGNLEKARARATAADIRQPLRQAPHRDHICSGPMPGPSAPRPVACCIGRRCMLHRVCCTLHRWPPRRRRSTSCTS